MKHTRYDDKSVTRAPVHRSDASLALRIGWAIVRFWWIGLIIGLGIALYFILGCRLIALGGG